MDLICRTILTGFKRELSDYFVHYFVKNLPGKIGRILRQRYWKRLFLGCGSLSFVCTITAPENMVIGEKVCIMRNC